MAIEEGLLFEINVPEEKIIRVAIIGLRDLEIRIGECTVVIPLGMIEEFKTVIAKI